MNDNEIKKARDEVERSTEVGKKSGKGSLFRRRSDISSSSSSSMASGTNYHENIPLSFGSNDQVRLTRSRLKSLLDSEVLVKPNTTNLTRKNSKKQTQSLEQVKENEELHTTPADSAATSSVKMSISNLKKHNAAMEKINEDSEQNTDRRKRTTVIFWSLLNFSNYIEVFFFNKIFIKYFCLFID